MAQKIFISYRRGDSAANALGIGQYLENEFGRKNVFIDIDMRAGTKFPAVLEQRLSECKVMLALIGPDWVTAQDEEGSRRLDQSDDWVRLEIATALKRGITVIPVRVNGADLPQRGALPEDIRGLLDHQAVSVTVTGFRHEMAGLVKDIRSISRPRSGRKIGAVAVGALSLLIAIALGQVYGPAAIERVKLLLFPAAEDTTFNGIWSGAPGEWILYGADRYPAAYYYKRDSVKKLDNRAMYVARYPLYTTDQSKPPMGAYADETVVFDCNNSTTFTVERTTYNKSGDITYHFKYGDPESPNLQINQPVRAGSMLEFAERAICNPAATKSMLLRSELKQNALTYLAQTASGDGEVFVGSKKAIDGPYQFEVFGLTKQYQDRKFSDDYPGQNVLGLNPGGYRTVAQQIWFSCQERKLRVALMQEFDSEGRILATPSFNDFQGKDIAPSGVYGLLMARDCGPAVLHVQGAYEGTNHFSYKSGQEGEQQISVSVEQENTSVTVSFQTVNGAQGKGTGLLTGSTVKTMVIQGLVKDCPGSLDASLEFSNDNLSWSYKGEDCNGPMEGHGTAKKAK